MTIESFPMLESLLLPSLRAAMLIAGLFLLRYLLGNRISPALRHALWGLVPIALLPMLAIPSPVSVYNLIPTETQSEPQSLDCVIVAQSKDCGSVNDVAVNDVADFHFPPSFSHTEAPRHEEEELPQERAGVSPPVAERVDSDSPGGLRHPALALMLIVWLTGAGIMALLFFRQSLLCRRWIAKAVPVRCEKVLNLYETCRRQMKVKTWLVIAESPAVPGPFLIGTITHALAVYGVKSDHERLEKMFDQLRKVDEAAEREE